MQIVDRQNVSQLSNQDVTALTISRMYEIVSSDSNHPIVVEAARDALRMVRGNRAIDKAKAIHWWIKKNVKFVQDGDLVWPWLIGDWGKSREVEVLVSPARLLTMEKMRGDCDDMSMLGMAMLKAVGVNSAFVTIKGNPQEPENWSHVFLVVALEDGQMVPMDCSHGKYVGWETNVQWEKALW